MKTDTTIRTVEATMETSETIVVRRPRPELTVWCDRCGKPAKMLKPEDAARITGTSQCEIYHAIVAGQVNFVEESGGGSLYVCLEDIIQTKQRKPN